MGTYFLCAMGAFYIVFRILYYLMHRTHSHGQCFQPPPRTRCITPTPSVVCTAPVRRPIAPRCSRCGENSSLCKQNPKVKCVVRCSVCNETDCHHHKSCAPPPSTPACCPTCGQSLPQSRSRRSSCSRKGNSSYKSKRQKCEPRHC